MERKARLDILQPHKNRRIDGCATDVKEVVVVSLSKVTEPEDNSRSQTDKFNGKFILIAGDTCLYFVFGAIVEFPYHAFLVEKFCSKRQIPSAWIRKPDVYEIYDPDYQIKGGGLLQLDGHDKTLRVYGQSTAYGRFNQGYLDQVVASDEHFHGFSVVIKE